MSSSRYKIPRMSDGSHMTFRRQPFLDGDAKTYFGPGQPPTCWAGYGAPFYNDPDFDPTIFDPHGTSTEIFSDRPYVPPTEWPVTGSLLRVPQVVHLTPFFLQNWLIGPAGLNGGPVDTPFYSEYQRLLDLFHAVKDKIESLRPSRTFVLVPELNVFFNRPEDGFLVGFYDFRRGRRFVEVVAPPASGSAFLGTDFLHIFCGHHARDVGDTGDTGNLARTLSFFIFDDGSSGAASQISDAIDAEMSSEEFSFSRDAAQGAKSVFPGYKTMLYSSNIAVPMGSSDPSDIDGHAIYDTSIQAVGDDLICSTVFDRVADQLSEYGFSHDGKTSDIASADQVVGMIASHFGFDPDSGADILG